MKFKYKLEKKLPDQLFECQEKDHHGHIAPAMTTQINFYNKKVLMQPISTHIQPQTERELYMYIYKERKREKVTVPSIIADSVR